MIRFGQRNRTILPLLALAFVVGGGAVRSQEVVALRAGTVITGAGEDVENGTVLIRQGKVVAVGKDVKVPFDAKVLRFPRGVIVPGLIECHSQAGLRISYENVPVVPFISVLDGIDPISKEFPNALRDGVTTIHVIPGNDTRIGGQGAVLRPVGATVDEMLLKSPSAIKLSLSPGQLGRFGATRMSHMAALRRDFTQLYAYLEGLVPKEDAPLLPETGTGAEDLTSIVRSTPDWKALDFSKIPEEKIDPQRRPLVDVVRGELPAFLYCDRASDLFKAFEIIDAHGIRARLVLGQDAHRAKDLLVSRADLGPVVLDADLEHVEIDPQTGKERRHPTARILFDAGIRFALQSRRGGYSSRGILSREGSYHLWYQAARLVRQGIPRQEAIRAVTLYPAQVLGLDHRLGTIEAGKDANVVVFTGDLFDVRSWVDRVFVEGREVYRRDADRDLLELIRKKEKGF